MSFVEKQLQEGEQLILFVRHYPLSYFLKAFALFVYFLVPFFFLFPLWEIGAIGKVIFFLLLLSAFLLIARFWTKVYFNSLIISDQRIIEIHQHGLFEQHVSEVRYEKIQNISYARKGLFQMLLGYGSVFVHSSSFRAPIEIKNVHNPQEVRELIARLMEESQRRYSGRGIGDMKEEEGVVRVVDVE